MPCFLPTSRAYAGALLLSLAVAGPALGQSTPPVATAPAPGPAPAAPARMPSDTQILALLQTLPVENGKAFAPLVNALLSDTAGHMRMAPARAATPADSARAAEVVRAMRASLEPYRDVAAAERDGYVRFLPWLEEQTIYHYNNMPNVSIAAQQFDAARPSSLLYRKDARGTLVLVGAMYTAPAASTPEELDARLPLGMAHWHQHVNFCAVQPAAVQDLARRGDSTTAARWLAIETREACAAAGGFFLPHLFGWMTHVNAFDGDTPAAIWGSEGRDLMHMHKHR